MGYACCSPRGGVIVRRYYARDERRAWLEAYADELENELKGVRERIERLTEEPT